MGLLSLLWRMEGHSLVFLLLVTSLVTASAIDVKTTVGEDIVLPCEGPEGEDIALQWKKSERSVLLYRGGRVEMIQDEQFRDRVQLQDPEMKSGNLNVIIKSVTEGDSGNYTCNALVQTSKRQKRDVEGEEITCKIQLFVQRPKEKDPQEPHRDQDEDTPTDSDGAAETRGSHVTAVIVVIVAVVILVAGILYRKIKEIKWQSVEQPHTPA